MSAKAKALLMTLMVFGGFIWYSLGHPGLDKLTELKARWADKSKVTKTKKSKTKSTIVGSSVGRVIDQYNGVNVYYNGSVGNVKGRNVTKDGYNLGLKYQCVEFAKRYYYERFGHKMPDSYGHAKDFYDTNLGSGQFNKARKMWQFANGGTTRPLPEDLVIIGPSSYNSFGHLFIITESHDSRVAFVQQNPGANNPSRGSYKLIQRNGRWTIDAPNVLGWLRK